MIKTTLKELQNLTKNGHAIDARPYPDDRLHEIKEKEGYLDEVAYSIGVYGCTARLYQGHNTRTLYLVGPYGPF